MVQSNEYNHNKIISEQAAGSFAYRLYRRNINIINAVKFHKEIWKN